MQPEPQAGRPGHAGAKVAVDPVWWVRRTTTTEPNWRRSRRWWRKVRRKTMTIKILVIGVVGKNDDGNDAGYADTAG